MSTFTTKIKNLPVPILPTMVGAATLSNLWNGLGFPWIRHLTMWIGALILLIYLTKIVFHFDTFKKEYSTAVPSSLYPGFCMFLMIFGSYIFTYSPEIGKSLWLTGIVFHTIHILLFFYLHVVKNFSMDHFVPSWFVTFIGLLVSTVIGVPMGEPALGRIIVWYGVIAFCILFPLVLIRLVRKPITTGPLFMTKAILVAPTSLVVVSYLNFIENPSPMVVYALYAIIFVTLLYIFWNLPKFFSFAFHPGFAGLTFPLAIACVATNTVANFLGNQGQEGLSLILKQIGGIQLYVTTGVITFVLFRFFMLFVDSLKKTD